MPNSPSSTADGLLHATSEAVAFWDANDVLVEYNYLFEELFGDIAPIQIGVTTFESLLRLAAKQQFFRMAPNVETWINERLKQHQSPPYQEILYTFDNRHFEIRERLQPNGWRLTLLKDISQQKRLESNAIHADLTGKRHQAVIAKTRGQIAELREELQNRDDLLVAKEKQISQFQRTTDFLVASLTRDLRNPLNAIISFADFIRSEVYGPSGDARYRTYADMATNTGSRLIEIMDQLSYLMKVSSDDPKLSPTSVRIKDLCGAAHEALVSKMDTAPSLHFQEGSEDIQVYVDVALASTAIEFTLRGLFTQYTPASFKVHGAASKEGTIITLETSGQQTVVSAENDTDGPEGITAGSAQLSGRSSAQLCFAIAETLAGKVNLEFTTNEVSSDSACARLRFPHK